MKFGAQYRVRHRRQLQPGWHERNVQLRHQQRAVQRQRSADVSGPSDGPRSRASPPFFEKAHYLSFFAQDKWKMSNRLTATIGVRYDVEKIPVAEKNNPKFASERRLSGGPRQYPAPRGAVVCGRRCRAVGRPRRLRTVLRQDALRNHRRPLQRRRVLGLVYPELPAPRLPIPDRGTETSRPIPFLVERSGAEQSACSIRCSRRDRRSATPAPSPWTIRLAAFRTRTRFRSATSVSSAATVSVSADFVRVLGRDMFMIYDKNKGTRTTTAATSPIVRPDPNVPGGEHVPERRGDRLQRAADAGREAAVAWHQRARVVHLRRRDRQPAEQRLRRSTSSRVRI